MAVAELHAPPKSGCAAEDGRCGCATAFSAIKNARARSTRTLFLYRLVCMGILLYRSEAFGDARARDILAPHLSVEDGESDPEDRSLLLLAFGGDGGSMHGRDPLRDGEPEPGALHLASRLIGAEKA